MRIFLVSIAAFFFLSCGTTHHYTPLRPMTDSKVQGNLSLSYALGDFKSISLQLAFFFKLTENDMAGLSLQSLMLPSSISYVKLWNTESISGSYQFHINNLMSLNHSPTYELRYAVFDDQINPQQSFEVGLGVYSTPLVYSLVGEKLPLTLSPILAYQYQGDSFLFQTQYIYGYSRYKTKEILDYRSRQYDYSSNAWVTEGPKLVYENDEIISFEEKGVLFQKWVIKTSDGDSLLLSSRDPYPDCFACGVRKRNLTETLPNDSYQVFWLVHKETKTYLVLNIQQGYSNYLEGKQVDLSPGKDYIQKSLKKNRFLIDDISLSIGRPMDNQRK